MRVSSSRWVLIAPLGVLILAVVASVAFSLGASSRGANTGGASTGGASTGAASPAPAAQSSGAPGNPRFGAVSPAQVVGTVASKSTSAIVVTTTAGSTVTVNVSPATTYAVRGVTGATLDNIAVGDRIAARGTFNADGSLNATQVQGGFAGRPGAGGFGRGFGGGGASRSPAPAPSGPST
jgi:Domain of unknown function (DUF5666)